MEVSTFYSSTVITLTIDKHNNCFNIYIPTKDYEAILLLFIERYGLILRSYRKSKHIKNILRKFKQIPELDVSVNGSAFINFKEANYEKRN